MHTYMEIWYNHRDQWKTINSLVIGVGIIDYGRTISYILENL